MIIPLLGFLLSIALFATLGAVTLPFAGMRPVRGWMLVAFIVAANAGGLAYSALYGFVFADVGGLLGSTSAVVGLLLGVPVAGALAGVAAVRHLARRFDRDSTSADTTGEPRQDWWGTTPLALGMRIFSTATLRDVSHATADLYRNHIGAGVRWCFTTRDARTKLARLYPDIG